MASSFTLLHHPIHRPRTISTVHCSAAFHNHSRRSLLVIVGTTAVFPSIASPATAKDIPLFGLRTQLDRVEQQAEEIIKEGEKAAEVVGEEAKKIVTEGEKTVEAVEREIYSETSSGFSVAGNGLVQAGVVAGAEAVGVLLGLSVVNRILGPEAQKSQ